MRSNEVVNVFGVVFVSFIFFQSYIYKFNVFIQEHVAIYFVTTTSGCI